MELCFNYYYSVNNCVRFGGASSTHDRRPFDAYDSRLCDGVSYLLRIIYKKKYDFDYFKTLHTIRLFVLVFSTFADHIFVFLSLSPIFAGSPMHLAQLAMARATIPLVSNAVGSSMHAITAKTQMR